MAYTMSYSAVSVFSLGDSIARTTKELTDFIFPLIEYKEVFWLSSLRPMSVLCTNGQAE